MKQEIRLEELFQGIDDSARLRNNFGEGTPLEAHSGIPLCAYRYIHAALELRFAGIWIRKVLDHVFRRLLVSFLRDDDMCFLVIRSSSRIHTSDLLDEMRLWLCFSGSRATP